MKAYVKPELYYENFELSEHIASCYYDMSNSTDINTCSAWSDRGHIIFMTRDVCTRDGARRGNERIDEICVQNGPAGFNVFNS